MRKINSLTLFNNSGKIHPSVIICDVENRQKGKIRIGNNYNLRSGTVIYQHVVIGNNFQTGHHAIIREYNKIGDNVVVGVGSYLGPDNVIGNNVKIHTNCFIEGCRIDDEVVISPGVVFTNDPYPPCKECVKKVGGAKVGRKTVIGANSTILPGIKIGKDCLIGAGSVVTCDLPDGVVAVGNPARIIKKVADIRHFHNQK